jgi:dTDP-glucose 4,6-dehydratase
VRLLVTGGAGFIGSNFLRRTLGHYPDYEILNLDQLTYAGNLENLADLENNRRHQFIHGDIGSAELVDKIMQSGVDGVVHFAAESHVDRSILDAGAFARTNIMGTLNLLEAARKNRVSRFLLVSTDEVYGSLGESGSFTEQSALAPNSPYAASKAAADLLLRSYHNTYGLPGLIARCSNNYGPYQFPEKLIPLFVTNALAGIPLPLYGDGLHVRDWIHVLDHCAALDRIVHHGREGEIYNIGARQEMPNIEIARLILHSLGKDDRWITFVQDRPGHDRRYAIDPAKIERELGWKPAIAFPEGIEQTIQWYRQNESWVKNVRSGQYQTYYDRMYRDRRKTLSDYS